jgi:S-adenosylmethionine-dependent methyltransferase
VRVSSFGDVEDLWSQRQGDLRNVVRQHVIRVQLHDHLAGVTSVLDVGCGQGTQAVALACLGLQVTGVDPSGDLLAQMEASASERACALEALQGDLHSLDAVVGERTFDLVCAHGLLMYLPDAADALRRLGARVVPGGRLSFTFRNGDALAFRAGVRGKWRAALDAFDSDIYVNEMGVTAHAMRLEDVFSVCESVGLTVEAWYGVRVFTDGRAPGEPPVPSELAECLAAEVEAGRRDPYRWFGSQVHVVASRR